MHAAYSGHCIHCGHHLLWPFTMATIYYGHSLWPPFTMATIHYGHHLLWLPFTMATDLVDARGVLSQRGKRHQTLRFPHLVSVRVRVRVRVSFG